MYRQYMTQEQYGRIVAEGRQKYPRGSDTPPHCNPDVVHAPGVCAYCDGQPWRQEIRAAGGTPFTPAPSNGWGGNAAPIVDDAKAAEEQQAWESAFDQAPIPARLRQPAPQGPAPGRFWRLQHALYGWLAVSEGRPWTRTWLGRLLRSLAREAE